MGGEVRGELAIMVTDTDALHLCANSNRFKQTTYMYREVDRRGPIFFINPEGTKESGGKLIV